MHAQHYIAFSREFHDYAHSFWRHDGTWTTRILHCVVQRNDELIVRVIVCVIKFYLEDHECHFDELSTSSKKSEEAMAGTVGEKCHYTEVLIKPKYRIFKLCIYWSQAHFSVINGSNLILLITKIAMWKCFGAMVWHSATRVPMQYSTYRHTARSASRHWFYCVLLFKFSFFGKYQIFTRFYHL